MQAKAFCLVAAALFVSHLGCKGGDSKPTPVPTPSASTTTATQPQPQPSATASTPPPASSVASVLPAPWEKHIKDGYAFDKTWTTGYSIYRKPGGVGMSILEAYAYCESHGKSLCSETQYRRACQEEPLLGQIETWTGSGDPPADELTVVGGEDCTTKQLVSTTDKKPNRSTLCCDRAVGVRTEYKSADFLVATQHHVGAYEAALKARDTLALADLYNEKVIFQNKVHDRAKLLEMHRHYWKAVPQQWTQFDYCRVTMQSGRDVEGNDDKQFQTDCAALFRVGSEVHFAMQRLIKGRSGKNAAAIIFIGDVSSSSAPSGIDMKAAVEKGMIVEGPSAAASGGVGAGAGPGDASTAAKEKKVRVGVLMTVD